MFKVNYKDTRTVFYSLYCLFSTYFEPFSSVTTVDFEQANVCWALPYQFINPEIT